jgi:hypothetical protein
MHGNFSVECKAKCRLLQVLVHDIGVQQRSAGANSRPLIANLVQIPTIICAYLLALTRPNDPLRRATRASLAVRLWTAGIADELVGNLTSV